ncbi:hypothetical protein PILCRDRAFT_562984 [Piloderma croceum F 1598]|uniref:Uncharacterized protein n=1 Tax=Piloderma croceum (strain F 1598) TaxID=765440 RepID=A0A0C3AZ72_PILCF|nr:hypothetical protein PILCRDRAFT_562984 [Piloderma croceum F 1598]
MAENCNYDWTNIIQPNFKGDIVSSASGSVAGPLTKHADNEFRKLGKNSDGTSLVRVIFKDTHQHGRTMCVRGMRELKRKRPKMIIVDVKREFDLSQSKMDYRKTPASSASHFHYDMPGMDDCCLH